MTVTCDLFGRCPDPALYRAWFDGPCGASRGSECEGHPVCPKCAADLRAGRRPLTCVKLEDLR